MSRCVLKDKEKKFFPAKFRSHKTGKSLYYFGNACPACPCAFESFDYTNISSVDRLLSPPNLLPSYSKLPINVCPSTPEILKQQFAATSNEQTTIYSVREERDLLSKVHLEISIKFIRPIHEPYR
jgi:hypothetical protein